MTVQTYLRGRLQRSLAVFAVFAVMGPAVAGLVVGLPLVLGLFAGVVWGRLPISSAPIGVVYLLGLTVGGAFAIGGLAAAVSGLVFGWRTFAGQPMSLILAAALGAVAMVFAPASHWLLRDDVNWPAFFSTWALLAPIGALVAVYCADRCLSWGLVSK